MMHSHDSDEGIYGFAPEPEVIFSTANTCTTDLDSEKKEAIRSYINTLGPELQKKYGKSDHYTPEQIHQTALAHALSIDYLCWGYMLFSSRSAFSGLHESAGEVCDFDAMRSVVSETFFHGNTDFNAIELASAVVSGSADALASGGEAVTSWLADVDWSALFDWA